MPNERYLDTNGLNEFWSQVKTYADAKINPTWVGYTSDQWQMTGTMIDVLFQIDLDKCSTTPKTGSYGMVIANGGNDAQGNDTSNYVMICKAESPPNPDSSIEGQQWVRVIYALELSGDINLAPGILLYASVADPIQKNHTTTMTKSGFVGPLPKVNDAGYGLLTYDKKLYQVAYHVSSIDSDGLYTIVYDGDPLLIGPSEGSGGDNLLLNSLNRQLAITQSQWTEMDGVYQCTVPCDGVIANEAVQNIYSTPAASQQSVCEEHSVKCIAQGTNTLTYQAKTLPPDLLMYVTIVNAGEMTTNLVAWSPKMTSNTKPAPYVVSGLYLQYGSSYAYNLYDNSLGTNVSFIINQSGYATIDLSKSTPIYGISVSYSIYNNIPMEFSLFGSANNSDFILIHTIYPTGTEDVTVPHIYKFNVVSYRYYKVFINTQGFGGSNYNPVITDISFLRPASDVEEVS